MKVIVMSKWTREQLKWRGNATELTTETQSAQRDLFLGFLCVLCVCVVQKKRVTFRVGRCAWRVSIVRDTRMREERGLRERATS